MLQFFTTNILIKEIVQRIGISYNKKRPAHKRLVKIVGRKDVNDALQDLVEEYEEMTLKNIAMRKNTSDNQSVFNFLIYFKNELQNLRNEYNIKSD